MPRKKIVVTTASPKPQVTGEDNVDSVLASLRTMSTRHDLNNLTRFGIATSKGIGVSMANMKKLARHIGRNHPLADGLWASGWYEARMLASLIDDPKLVTPIQMDRWCRDFDNWGICDTVCFALFDRTPHAWKKVSKWSTAKGEFQKRAAFALLWGLSVHDKQARDEEFVDGLALIERGADDDRHYVKKGVNMALRAIGKRSPSLRVAAIAVSRRLSKSSAASAQWIGKDALHELDRGKPAGGTRHKTKRPPASRMRTVSRTHE